MSWWSSTADHRHQEFLSFLSTLDRQAPKGYEVHVIVDNLSAHSTQEVQRWLHAHPRFRMHFTPTHSSWLNAVEGWFSKLTTKALRRGSFVSVPGPSTGLCSITWRPTTIARCH